MKIELRGDAEFWANVIACAESAMGRESGTLWLGEPGSEDSPAQIVFWPLTVEPGCAVRVEPDEVPSEGSWEAFSERADAADEGLSSSVEP